MFESGWQANRIILRIEFVRGNINIIHTNPIQRTFISPNKSETLKLPCHMTSFNQNTKFLLNYG